MKKTLLIKGKYVLTMDKKHMIIPNGAIMIEDDKILDVGPLEKLEKSYSAGETIDAKESVIMPGLVCTHTHMYGILSHGIPIPNAPKTFIEFLKKFWWPKIEDKINKKQIYAAAQMSAIEMAKTGTTCCTDILEAPNAIPGALDIEAKATEKIGLRSILSFEATERISQENGWKGVKENLNFIKKHNSKSKTLTHGMFCTHTTFTCSTDLFKKVRSLANENQAGIHIHLEEGAYESQHCLTKYKKLPAELYQKIGFLASDVLASQCVHTTQKEIKILKKHDVKIAHMPLSNCEVGGGIAPVPNMLNQNLTVGLGTDGYINDMFKVMRATFLIHKGNLQDASVMPAETVIKMATVEAAKAIGMNDSIGSLTPGKKADLITLDMNTPTPLTHGNLITHIVVYGDGNMVQDAIVNGKTILKRREIQTVAENDARRRCREAATNLWKT